MKENILKARQRELKVLKRAMAWVGGMFLTLASAPTISMGTLISFYDTLH